MMNLLGFSSRPSVLPSAILLALFALTNPGGVAAA